MITHGGILTAYCKAKEAILKSLHTAWFHIYDILEKNKTMKTVRRCQWLPVVRGRKGQHFLPREQFFTPVFSPFQNWTTGKVVVAVMLVLITLASLLLNNRNQHTLWVHFTTGFGKSFSDRRLSVQHRAHSASCKPWQHKQCWARTVSKVGGDKVPRYSHALNSSLNLKQPQLHFLFS